MGSDSSGIEDNPSNEFMYVTNLSSNEVSVISGSVVFKTIDVGDEPFEAKFIPTNKYVCVTNRMSDDVFVIRGITIIIGPAANARPNLKVDGDTLVY